LTPYARNSRTHSEAQVAQIAASIREFGFTNPVLIDGKGEIIAGHGRVLAAQSLGLEAVPVLILDHLTEDQRRAYVIADNKLALNAGWDEDLLRQEIEALSAASLDLDLLGFDQDELAALLNPPSQSEADPDETPEPPAVPVTRPGDVWLMDKHRIICGDSTDATTVEALLGGVKPNLMVTDPPYGVNYDPSWRDDALQDDSDRSQGKVENDHRADWREAYALFPGEVAYVWHPGLHTGEFFNGLKDSGFEIRAQIIWKKPHFALGRSDYQWQHEACWYAARKAARTGWGGDRTQSTVWEVDAFMGHLDKKRGKGDEKTGHGTQKPVELFARCIRNNSNPGQAVYEPFSGSGTCIIAAEREGRLCYAIELNPAYVDVAVMRWENFAGRVATLQATGQSFREVRDERRALAA
jgi:DNA modification methylase